MMLARSGTADPPTYRFVDLGVLSGDDESIAYGLNELGYVVGKSSDDIAVDAGSSAFLWLHEADYNLSAGMHELDLLEDGTYAIARDVNDAGMICGVGDIEIDPDTLTRAILWLQSAAYNLSAGANDLGGLDTDTDSSAWALTEETNPLRVVGDAEDDPKCQPVPVEWKLTAFQNTLTAMPLGTHSYGTAYGIGPNPDSDADKTIVGDLRSICTNRPDVECEEDDLEIEPVYWKDSTAQILDLSIYGDHLGTAFDANDNQEIVGDAVLPIEFDPFEFFCFGRAGYWHENGAVYNLHDGGAVDPDLQSDDESVALAINNSTNIVGYHVDPFGALLWTNPYLGTWDLVELNDEILGGSSDCDVVLWQAWDINESGWIVGLAAVDASGTPDFHAYLLVPLGDCPEDLDGDGDVDEDDLDILDYSGTEFCTAGLICWRDVNGDCQINIEDYRQIIEAYGPCGGLGETQMSSGMIDTWLAAGGEDALENQELNSTDVTSALDETTAVDEFLAMMALIAE